MARGAEDPGWVCTRADTWRGPSRITASGGVRADEPAGTLAVRAPRDSSVELTGRLTDGRQVPAVR
ncbi:hypothetical protein OG705_02825 [Streptomyces sp. NBC_00838]|uniref:hypothetical protein n=1 Tax=Streptomyces sp. NBC_00838 TaxID=2903680 RepID=UPI00386AB7EF|nr:hypothetical protein OG705_02825 [Streptomyces sp. NBC_00838]